MDDDVYEMLSIKRVVNMKNVVGGTAFNQVESRINDIMEVYKWKRDH